MKIQITPYIFNILRAQGIIEATQEGTYIDHEGRKLEVVVKSQREFDELA